MSDKQEPMIRVECYAGYRADEEPRCFYIGKRKITINAIIDRWLHPKHRYFKVRGDDDGIYILRNDVNSDMWEMILYDSGSMDDNYRLSST